MAAYFPQVVYTPALVIPPPIVASPIAGVSAAAYYRLSQPDRRRIAVPAHQCLRPDRRGAVGDSRPAIHRPVRTRSLPSLVFCGVDSDGCSTRRAWGRYRQAGPVASPAPLWAVSPPVIPSSPGARPEQGWRFWRLKK